LADMLDRLEPDLQRTGFTHSSWTKRRSESYERLAFLGDSVLGLAFPPHLSPRLEADRYGPGRLTKIRAQAVSGRSCRAVAERLRPPARAAGPGPPPAPPRGVEGAGADPHRAGPGGGDRGGDRGLLSRLRLRADSRRGRRGVHAGD